MQFFRLLPLFAAAALFAQTARHPLTLDDLARFREVRDPQCSPDGQWVAYTVTTTDAKEDKHDTDVWMVGIDGQHDLRLTSSPENETTPALRSLGVDTQLIIYPNETHGIQRPSYQRDRMERYLAWYDKYLKKSVSGATGAGAEVR
jgi:dipeptidyl aminopeptidase/acylaminoacyl peptidase